MKKILFAILIAFSTPVISQEVDTLSAGDHLVQFERKHSIGVNISLLGTVVALGGAAVVSSPVILLGSALGLAGYAVSASSFAHARKAGELLNKISISTELKPTR